MTEMAREMKTETDRGRDEERERQTDRDPIKTVYKCARDERQKRRWEKNRRSHLCKQNKTVCCFCPLGTQGEKPHVFWIADAANLVWPVVLRCVLLYMHAAGLHTL